jgi:hypothetical protein
MIVREQQGFPLLIFCIVSHLSENFIDMNFIQGLYYTNTNHNKIHLSLHYKFNQNHSVTFAKKFRLLYG